MNKIDSLPGIGLPPPVGGGSFPMTYAAPEQLDPQDVWAMRVALGEAARELRVSGPTMFQAEEVPEKSLHKLRKQIIERYSEYEVVGPVYVIRRKLLTRQSDTILSPP